MVVAEPYAKQLKAIESERQLEQGRYEARVRAGDFGNASTSYELFKKMRGQEGTYLLPKMGYLFEIPGEAGPILLLSPKVLSALPNGTVVWGLNGKMAIKGVDTLSMDVREGMTWYGLRPAPELRGH